MKPARSLDHIARKTAQTTPFRQTVARLENGDERVLLHGLPNTLAAFLLAHVQRSLTRPLLVVAPDEDRAERWRDDLLAILGDQIVHYFPAWDCSLYEGNSPSEDITGLRLGAAVHLMQGGPAVVVAPATALLAPLIPPHALELGTLTLRPGQEHDPDALTAHLSDCGFERVPVVDGTGQFSLRGGILDLYPVNAEHPLRFEFFGDEIESIRTFDAATQRSLHAVEEAIVPPAHEVVLLDPFTEEYLERLDKLEKDEGFDLKTARDPLELGSVLEGVESYMALLYGRDNGLFEYLKQPIVFCDEAEDLANIVDKALEPAHKEHKRLSERQCLPSPQLLLRDGAWLCGQLDRSPQLLPAPLGQADQALRFGASEPRNCQGQLPLLQQEIVRLDDESYAIDILCETQGQSSRLEEIVGEWSERISYDLGTLNQGFVYPEARLALFNDHEIFTRQKRRYRYRKFRAAAAIPSFNALQRGDFVVHVDHGVGRYAGIRRLNIGNREHDCLIVNYQGDDKVFVPVEQLDRLRKYSTAEGEPPLLNKLGSNAWERLKERTREEIFKMAGELVQLYAERKARPGYAFSTDTAMHRALEASFPFQETADQLRAMEDVRGDMEAPHPMDRLICGDVGYGKTEVAVRAAFKAVCDNRQVAVLVPTTILAQQHYQTFAERMADTPARVEVLSRFRTPKEIKQVLADLRVGKVDVLIGTHRILSKDIKFRDLGLLVIDEEQRFGVKDKEKLKQLKRLVDVVTLTATPIPRTLHMSLMSARDMSVINTPPQDRLPIHTEIFGFDEERIMGALNREIERGGQVYFVHNRVQSIHRLTSYLQELMPHMRFGVAHGQMPPRQLEQIMMDFMHRRYDCLVCTMIIESGIDIPSVNTILVNRADRLGLSQLYQIRGRVGRSKERAYAYLMIPKGKKLTKKSRLRLHAIEEFSDLGSGFNIAMRDMEIRGAGNLLGPQQHGVIAAVGFDLYCRLLDEAVRELKGEVVADAPEPEVLIAVSAYMPDDYVADPDQKMDFYQRLADARRLVDLLAIEEELRDRFGRLPIQARALMYLMEIKVMARQLGLEAVQLERDTFRMSFPAQRQLERAEIQHMVERSSAQLEFKLDAQFVIEVRTPGRDEIERLEKSRDALREILG
jgi:transcription-repair coupling factor (superfamily II helicase)